jgi:hypothetical protein
MGSFSLRSAAIPLMIVPHGGGRNHEEADYSPHQDIQRSGWETRPRSVPRNQIGESCETAVDFVDSRADESPCQCELVISSEIFFASHDLLIGVSNGVAANQGQVHKSFEEIRFG